MQRTREHNILGIFTSQWNILRSRHRNHGIHRNAPNSAGSAASHNPVHGESVDEFLWDKCFEVCKATHTDSLPCFTMADFNAFLTHNTQNFVTKGCRALDLYNDIFGKQDLDDKLILQKNQVPQSARSIKSRHSERSTLRSCNIGSFLDDAFLSKAVEAVAKFLQKDFQNPLIPINCTSNRKKEIYVAIECYLKDVDCACLSIPAFLEVLKLAMELIEELKLQIYTEGSTWVSQELKDEVQDTVADFESLSSSLTAILQMIDSGNTLINILSAWANYEYPLAEILVVMRKRHETLLNTSPFDDITKIKKSCDYIGSTVHALADTANAFDVPPSNSPSQYSFSSRNSRHSAVNTRNRPPIVELSRHSLTHGSSNHSSSAGFT